MCGNHNRNGAEFGLPRLKLQVTRYIFNQQRADPILTAFRPQNNCQRALSPRSDTDAAPSRARGHDRAMEPRQDTSKLMSPSTMVTRRKTNKAASFTHIGECHCCASPRVGSREDPAACPRAPHDGGSEGHDCASGFSGCSPGATAQSAPQGVERETWRAPVKPDVGLGHVELRPRVCMHGPKSAHL